MFPEGPFSCLADLRPLILQAAGDIFWEEPFEQKIKKKITRRNRYTRLDREHAWGRDMARRLLLEGGAVGLFYALVQIGL
jgi:hypothetical protein